MYKGNGCKTCPFQKLCTKSKKGIRYLKVFPHRDLQEAMTTKMLTTKAKETYKLRAQTVEPAIGDIKHNKGFQSFLTRGLETAKTEFNLVCTGHNVRKLWIQTVKNHIIKPDNLLFKKISNLSKSFYSYSPYASE